MVLVFSAVFVPTLGHFNSRENACRVKSTGNDWGGFVCALPGVFIGQVYQKAVKHLIEF